MIYNGNNETVGIWVKRDAGKDVGGDEKLLALKAALMISNWCCENNL